MRIQIDTINKIVILIDPVTFNEIDGVLDEIKKLVNEDLMQWKIKTLPSDEIQKESNQVYQPSSQPVIVRPYYTGDPLPNQIPTTWCGDSNTNSTSMIN